MCTCKCIKMMNYCILYCYCIMYYNYCKYCVYNVYICICMCVYTYVYCMTDGTPNVSNWGQYRPFFFCARKGAECESRMTGRIGRFNFLIQPPIRLFRVHHSLQGT